ncbi:hypothetical protein MY5147_002645 [Beauveria neobassiana]
MAARSNPLLEAVFDHLVLPPKLPAAPEDDSIPLSWELTTRLITACRQIARTSLQSPWDTLETSLLLTRSLQGPVSVETLMSAFSTIAQEEDEIWFAFHVAQQNAAIIVHRSKETDEVVFEAFEVSASAPAVLEAKHALNWKFPCRAVAIPMTEFVEPSFQTTIAEFVEQATEIALDQFAARAYKGDKTVVETRDTPSPALITEMFMSYLEAIGRAVPVHIVQKRVRDDVVLGSSEHPWRRSPHWLLLRVFVQRYFMTKGPSPHEGRICFKLAMCVALSHLLSDCQTKIHPERVLMLQAKLCRRLAKLQTEISKAPVELQNKYGENLLQQRAFFESTVMEAKRVITAIWNEYTRKAARPIPLLPWTADQSDLILRLPNSGHKLRALLSMSIAPSQRPNNLGLPSHAEGTVTQVNEFATRYSILMACASTAMSTLFQSYSTVEDTCIGLSQAMTTYMDAVGGYYADDAILVSQYLLNLFEMWVFMDSAATRACPTLKEYHPCFVPEALDMLCFTTRCDMARLRQVQKYIFNRIKHCSQSRFTIFSDPNNKAAFAASYMRAHGEESGLESLLERINERSATSIEAKKKELDLRMSQYQKLTVEMKSGTCVCKRQPDGTLDVRGCTRCWKARCRKRLRIQVHEAFLPRKTPDKAAILLEMEMPEYIEAYRDATWRLRMLGCQNPERGCDAVVVLADFGPLKFFDTRLKTKTKAKSTTSLTLASRSKAYLQTHYRELKLPKMAVEVLLPFGPVFTYYDTKSGIWANDCTEPPWYHHMLGSWLPEGISDPFDKPEVYMDDREHPSSYEVVANQDDCPSGMSHHEFNSYQAAISGAYRRWMVLALELGSTNLNLSDRSTVKCFKRLALQSGPPQSTAKWDALGKFHSVFLDSGFCETLQHQLCLRLSALQSSRRDLDGMSVVITCALRLFHLRQENSESSVVKLLQEARSLLSLWISQYRQEVRCARDGKTAQSYASSAVWASLLSRQTFTTGSFNDHTLDETEALHFFRASIAFSENLIVNLDAVSPDLQQLLAQYVSWAYTVDDEIKQMTLRNTLALETAINETWTHAGETETRSFSKWKFCDGGNWLTARTAATPLVSSQTIHYHPIQGHLLIDGKTLGRLPLAMQEDAGITELFQGQHLLTRASGVAGMEYQIINSVNNHEVHVGMSENEVIIRARFNGHLLQYVPRSIFRSYTTSDLPTGLVEDCVHWLNLQTGELEMRRKPGIWTRKRSNWVLDVRSHTAVRGRGRTLTKEGTSLVEPQSDMGRTIASIFRHFEDPGNLTIFQPLSDKGRLSVEIKRLEMRFFVNRKGLLQSNQLKSEIDPIQNIGTLHGLQSKIVLRNTANPRRQSVIVPFGPCFWERNGPHVSVRILNDGHYALFTVDPLLGRLNCAPEPALFYMKALIHALTSFPLPDKLTGRTGTEEACMCLTAAQSQPWKPLNPKPRNVLSMIMNLSPKREYYPPSRRLYQRVTWDDNLTATVQHEQLAIHAKDIMLQSQALDSFYESKVNEDMTGSPPVWSHLALRGILRRQVYERVRHPSDLELLAQANQNTVYHPRGVDSQADESKRVYGAVKQLRDRSSKIPPSQPLYRILKKWRVFDGFSDAFDTLDISRNLCIETSQAFGPLIQLLTSSPDVASDHMAQLSLALFLFGTNRCAKVSQWLVAIGSNVSLQAIEPPRIERLTQFYPDQVLDESVIKQLIISCQESYVKYMSQIGAGRKARRAAPPNLEAYNHDIEQEAQRIASWLESAWPDLPLTDRLFIKGCDQLRLKIVSAKKIYVSLEPELHRMAQNRALSEYIRSLEAAAQLIRNDSNYDSDTESAPSTGPYLVGPAALIGNAQSSLFNPEDSSFRVPSLTEVVVCCREYADLDTGNSHPSRQSIPELSHQADTAGILKRLPAISRDLSILNDIVQPFKTSGNMIQQQYGQDLEESIVAMAVSLEKPRAPFLTLSQDSLDIQIESDSLSLDTQYHTLTQALVPQIACHYWLKAGQLWPCDSLVAVLGQLRLENYKCFSPSMQKALISLGSLITSLQRLQRIEDAKLLRDDKKFLEESQSVGHSNWSPADYPEWLLLEIDNNILIRPLQVDVAKAIISPHSGRNSVLQMNMGTGKTSVVMPMAALVLADTTRLCRVIVPKALLLQTAQVMQSRIGGLIGRQVRHVPFSRRSSSDAATLANYRNIHSQMLQTGGLMLCIPAHVLSFKLSGLQRLADHQQEEGRQMVEIQSWLDSTCRDILDESDMTLSVYTQLIYPSGDLTTLDGNAYRWLIVEQLLGFVEKHSSHLQKDFEGKVVVVQRRQGFPIIHFITKEPEDALNELLAEDICNGCLPQLQIRESESEDAKHLIRRIISGAHVSSSEWQSACKSLEDDPFGPKALYLLRGLISQRILVVCLKKKWNVQYGLHPERQPIAVPFEAKGTPSQAAEYGHPDTTLILTCLAFYQQGLSKKQLKQGLQGVMQSDDAAAHYDRWICSCTALPASLRYWNLLDPENDLQVETLWGYLRFDRTVINHHLNTYVFPRYAKQFPVKLLASGWDIPLLQSTDSGQERSLTTGFSGTNDNKRILPQTIKQNDLRKLLYTNAEVLCYLLESRNAGCHLTAVNGVRFGEEDTLRFLRDKGIRVLIDAGAHILEMENHEVARKWLDIDPEAEGALYFGTNSQIMVRSRFQKDPMPLIASPFANDIQTCVVYIDEGHTRGTDLKLPADAKGAVTLSLGQTKDQTVQGKLRQLGTTQSVAFLAPPEVHRSILDLRVAHVGDAARAAGLTSRDVVRWLLEQSCNANEQMMSLYLSQCWDFCRRTDVLWKHPDYATSKRHREKVLDVIKQEEQQTLQQMYGPRVPSEMACRVQLASRQLQTFAENAGRMAQYGQTSYSSALMEVEQEREVVLEVEHMREKETRARHVALAFPGLDTAILDFIATGRLKTGTGTSRPLLQAFDYVGRTRIGKSFGVGATKSRLYVSHEFTHVIDTKRVMEKMDIARPVNWILWSPSSETALIIIPEEADVVIPLLRKMVKPLVWLLGYTAPVTKSMQSFNCLSYLTIPRWPRDMKVPVWLGIEVGVFSGRLYFEFAEYEPLLAWLGLLPDSDERAGAGGFISKIHEPLQFLQEWLTFRRQTEDILYTPAGFVCQRQHLHQGHFFFSSASTGPTGAASVPTSGLSQEVIDEED